MVFDGRFFMVWRRTGSFSARGQPVRCWPSWEAISSSSVSRWELRTSPEGTIHTGQIWKRFRADRKSRYLQDEFGRLTERLTRRRESTRWRWALRGIDFSVQPGSSVGLIGINGSGKTTLLKIINQVMYPTVGRV